MVSKAEMSLETSLLYKDLQIVRENSGLVTAW